MFKYGTYSINVQARQHGYLTFNKRDIWSIPTNVFIFRRVCLVGTDPLLYSYVKLAKLSAGPRIWYLSCIVPRNFHSTYDHFYTRSWQPCILDKAALWNNCHSATCSGYVPNKLTDNHYLLRTFALKCDWVILHLWYYATYMRNNINLIYTLNKNSVVNYIICKRNKRIFNTMIVPLDVVELLSSKVFGAQLAKMLAYICPQKWYNSTY